MSASTAPVEAAQQLADYLDQATNTAPPPVAYGRTPWIHMTAVQVTAVEGAVIVTFRWSKTEQTEAIQYVLVLGADGLSPFAESDRWITRLDLYLDREGWTNDAIRIGSESYLVIPPDRKRQA
jgi:hypothetical protein